MNSENHDTSFLLQFDPPYSFLRSVFPMKDIQEHEAAEFLRLRSSARLVMQSDGIILWNISEYDSQLLDRTCAKVHRVLIQDYALAADLIRKLVRDLTSQSVSYTSVRIPADYRLVQIFEDEGFRVVDGIIYLYIDLQKFVTSSSSVVVREATNEDHERLLAISESAFVYGRFYHDPSVTSQQADAIYKHWVENSLNGDAADHVLVAEYEGQAGAFITLKKIPSEQIDVGSIELLAVGGESRGKGLASALMSAAVSFFKEQSCKAMIVDTQITNLPALGLYTKFGFKFGKTYLTLRLQL